LYDNATRRRGGGRAMEEKTNHIVANNARLFKYMEYCMFRTFGPTNERERNITISREEMHKNFKLIRF